jgi:hypothetical protein
MVKKVALCLGILAGLISGSVRAAEPMGGAGAGPAHAMPGHAMTAPSAAAHGPGDQMSCGQKIAGMAGIPAKLSEGASSVADMLDAHAALMGKEKEAAAEAKGLRALAKTHKQIAASLTKASEEMKKAANWPAAPHDMAKMMSDPKLAAASQKVIDVHKEIIAMMQKMVADMEAQQKAMK